MKKRAFTLVELMVVLAIVALLSGLIFGAVSSVKEGNKRGSCQSNMNQIYAALRLYGQDNDGQFPYYDPQHLKSVAGSEGIGLWALYVYQAPGGGFPLAEADPNDPSNLNKKNPVFANYLKSPRAFHCPSDSGDADRNLEIPLTSGTQTINTAYLSYQGSYADAPGVPLDTYSTFRTIGAKRQLGNDSSRHAPDQTVVTWCRFHRPLDSTGTPTTNFNPTRTFDNILFLDGSVQSVPVEQTVTLVGGSTTAQCRGWKRVPLAEANAVPQQYVIDACNTTP